MNWLLLIVRLLWGNGTSDTQLQSICVRPDGRTVHFSARESGFFAGMRWLTQRLRSEDHREIDDPILLCRFSHEPENGQKLTEHVRRAVDE